MLENIDERDKDIFESLCKEDIEKAHKKAVDKGLLDVAEEIEIGESLGDTPDNINEIEEETGFDNI